MAELSTVGFIGLGNVGGKLAGSVLRGGYTLYVLDQKQQLMDDFAARGAHPVASAKAMMESVDMVITCLPSPAASASVLEDADGILAGLGPGQIWAEMSTNDEAEIRRLATLVKGKGGEAVDCPVSGGCHRAATGNISIFAGCDRSVFERILPVLSTLGRQILHTGPLGSASILKVVTNYLATANLVSICEALTASRAAGMDLRTSYEAIRISSGNSFVHETEGQVILNGSRNINFTMDLVLKDVGLFCDIAERAGLSLELAPMLRAIFQDGADRYGMREWSPNIIRRLEDQSGLDIRAAGFPEEILDDSPECEGAEIKTH
ncbi:MAG: NAD(P)-dependent oxidoreductase [Pseudomonadota bacterium]